MPDHHTVSPGDSLWSISKKYGVSFQELKGANSGLKTRIPPYGVNPGDTVALPRPLQRGRVATICRNCSQCVKHDLAGPRLIATAADPHIVPVTTVYVTEGGTLALGQDATFASTGTATPARAAEEADLNAATLGLIGEFARDDPDGKALKLFTQFLSKKSAVEVFTDPALDRAVLSHPNFETFSARALNAPGLAGYDRGRSRIHQALKRAAWDINSATTVTGLGVLAFNRGSAFWQTDDFTNGLAVMINGTQYVFIYAQNYHHDSCKQEYDIRLRYVIYDVFGLDDDDLREYGGSLTAANRGITAWWRLQHQFGYAPLVTKVVVERDFLHVSTAGP